MSAISPAMSPPPSSYLSGMEISWRGSDDGSVPGMVSSASLQSFAGDVDDCSLSSGAAAPSSSPRSIFQSYWSSAAQRGKPGLEEEGEDDSSARLQTLKMPSVGLERKGRGEASATNRPAVAAVEGSPGGVPKTAEAPGAIAGRSGRREPFDDTSVDYQSALASPLPTRSARRRILPTPPAPTPLSSSLLLPRRPQLTVQPYARQKAFSTTALLANRRPHQSCLRKARTTIGVLGGGAEPASRDDPKKSVSFYSRVSVHEFAVPPVKSHTEWYDHFT